MKRAFGEQRANSLIMLATGSGDSEIEWLAKQDLRLAQEEVLRRVTDRLAEEQRLRDVAAAHQMQGYVGQVPAAG